MADILPQTAATLHIDPPSPLGSPLDDTETFFVDAPEQSYLSPTNQSAPIYPSVNDLHSSSNLQPPGEESAKENARAHSRRHKSLALPAFSFNPSVSLDTTNNTVSPPTSPKSTDVPTSPSKRKHRRVRSELVGGDSRHQSPVTSTGPNVDKIAEDLAKRDILDPPGALPPFKGHRHRRSGAVSSKDLSAVHRPSSSDVNHDSKASSSGPPTPTFNPTFPIPSVESPRGSPVRVSFSDNVEVIPRRSLPVLKVTDQAPVSRPTHSSDGAETRSILSPSEYLESIRPTSVATTPASVPSTSTDSRAPLDLGIDSGSNESLSSLGDFPSVSIVEHANDDIDSTAKEEAITLDENFDNDPTAAIVIPEPQNPQPSSPRSPTVGFEGNKSPEVVIDLDSANDVEEAAPMTAEELRNLRAKSFSAARHSMHSGGMDAATTRLNHRRTESVPSIATAFFERPVISRNDSQTASERGFVMENVFEEEEEEVQTSCEDAQSESDLEIANSQFGLGLGLEHGSCTEVISDNCCQELPSTHDDMVGTQDMEEDHDTPTPTNDSDIPSRSQTIRHAPSNRHSLVHQTVDPSSEFEVGSRSSDEFNALRNEARLPDAAMFGDQRPSSQPLPYPAAPPWTSQPENSSFGSTPQAPSNSSAWSTPKLDTAATSLHEAHLGLPRSNADVVSLSTEGVPSGIPSLVSSVSTMSGTHRYAGSTTSPSTPGGTQTGDSILSMSSQQEKRRKRSSIQSLSQLLGYTGSTKSNLSVEQSSRCQTSSGLSIAGAETPSKEKRRKRLSRALKFWKPKDSPPG